MINAITQVWGQVVSYITSNFSNITALFWTPASGEVAGSLTFVGTLAVIMAGVSLMLLVFNLIRSFLSMRG